MIYIVTCSSLMFVLSQLQLKVVLILVLWLSVVGQYMTGRISPHILCTGPFSLSFSPIRLDRSPKTTEWRQGDQKNSSSSSSSHRPTTDHDDRSRDGRLLFNYRAGQSASFHSYSANYNRWIYYPTSIASHPPPSTSYRVQRVQSGSGVHKAAATEIFA